MAEKVAAALGGRDITARVRHRSSAARETAGPIARRARSIPGEDERLSRATTSSRARTSVEEPVVLAIPLQPGTAVVGRAYREIAARVLAAGADARDAAGDAEAVLVSHQLPIWVTRPCLRRKALWHRPDRRECALGSVTSLVYESGEVVEVRYEEPAGSLGRRTVGGA